MFVVFDQCVVSNQAPAFSFTPLSFLLKFHCFREQLFVSFYTLRIIKEIVELVASLTTSVKSALMCSKNHSAESS